MGSRLDSQTRSGLRLADLYAPIAREMEQVEAVLVDALRSPVPYVQQLTEHTAQYGGKRVRPALLLLSGKACGRVGRNHVVLAAVIEMIHTATLVHDDVLDGADVRRHVPTVHTTWGQHSGILLGDLLFSRAFHLAAGTGSAEVCRTIGETTNTVCGGELAQIAQRGNLQLTEAEYLDVIQRKTASLTACSCRLGAELAGASADRVRALDQFGRLVGIGFQIVDDVLDLIGQQIAMGKSLGTDIREHKATLPLVRLLADAAPAEMAKVRRLWDSPDPRDMERLRRHLSEGPYIDAALAQACHYIDQACGQLDVLPPSDSKAALLELAGFIAKRTF